MIWLVMILIHGVLCVVALADLASLWMSPRARAAWFVAVLLLPVAGVAAYALAGRRRYDAEGHAWPGAGASDGAKPGPVTDAKGDRRGPGGAGSRGSEGPL